MDGFWHTFDSSRTTEPDRDTLLALLRAAVDPSVGLRQHLPGDPFAVKKNTAWTPAQIAAAQTVIDSAPATTPQLSAQRALDQMPREFKAVLDWLIDELNVVRAALPTPRPAIGWTQALSAARAKAGDTSWGR